MTDTREIAVEMEKSRQIVLIYSIERKTQLIGRGQVKGIKEQHDALLDNLQNNLIIKNTKMLDKLEHLSKGITTLSRK